jgi:hypothetical protein
MSAIMSDVLSGSITPAIANGMCKAADRLIKHRR